MLKNKVVLITGGAGLIGREFVKTVALNQGVAVIVDINEKFAKDTIQDITEELVEERENLFFKKANISSLEDVENLIREVNGDFGRIDALINNAYPKSKSYGKKFFEITSTDFNEFISLHLGGYFNISQQLIKHFLKQGHGNIINISSIQGVGAPAFETYEGTNMHSPIEYTVAKHGLIGMTKYFAKMFKKDNIRVNAISPGGILDKQPERFLQQYKNRCGNKGMLDSQDLNGTLLYLLSDMSKFLTGQNLIIDDGFLL